MREYSGRVLIVDDDPIICDLLEAELEAAGFWPSKTNTLSGLKETIRQRSFDWILLDMFLGDEDALQALPFLVRECPYSKVIMMSAHGSVELAVDAMEQGASSFVSKTKDPKDIVTILKQKISEEAPALPRSTDTQDHGIVGGSEAISDVLAKIARISDVDSTVLVVGQSGTGKELVARAIHNTSNRAKERFEAINCGAIPENLLESELFGHKRGAFTDAKSDRQGLFEICSNGTLFLDEIGDMPISLQVKLNRVLQEKEILPLGSSRTQRVNTRVIAATNKNLAEEVRLGNFREDLYYRLAVLKLDLPALRDRRTDVPVLLRFFLNQFNQRFNKSVLPPSKELELRLCSYDWPGNVRQLQNAIERGVILSTDGSLRLEDMLPEGETAGEGRMQHNQYRQDFWLKPLSDAKKGFEKDYLRHLLEVTKGNISEIARVSGRYRADVYRLLTKYGIDWEEFRG